MTQEEAIKILIQVALVAQSKGALSLEDAVIVKQSIDLFKAPESAKVEDKAPEAEKIEDAEVVI